MFLVTNLHKTCNLHSILHIFCSESVTSDFQNKEGCFQQLICYHCSGMRSLFIYAQVLQLACKLTERPFSALLIYFCIFCSLIFCIFCPTFAPALPSLECQCLSILSQGIFALTKQIFETALNLNFFEQSENKRK